MHDGPEKRYFNRELSWLFFNRRVLEEAQNPNVPLLERVRFLSISASNLDEFYMVRVAGIRTQVLAGMETKSAEGLTPAEQIDHIGLSAGKIVSEQGECWSDLVRALAEEDIFIRKMSELSESQKQGVRDVYETTVLPLLSPLAVDPAHPFPFLPNLGFGMALSMDVEGRDEPMYGLIIIPQHVDRFMAVPNCKQGLNYVLFEDVLKTFAQDLFPDFQIKSTGLFRITRDSDIAIDEDAEDLVRHFEFLLKQRRRGRVIRLETGTGIAEDLRAFLIDSFECWHEDIQDENNMLGLSDVSEIITKHKAELLFPSFTARFPERIREFDGDCFAAIAAKDIVVHHPYEEFDVVVQFLKQAAADPNVVAIKQTLYRTSDDSPIVAALIAAAEKGKIVTALVELKARFDEATNLRWARDLERAGAHVVYGFVGYKTHAKVSLVIRREEQTLKTYVHLGTGNYHAQNAKIYTDLALFTDDPEMGQDVGKLFNYVTSYSRPRDLKKLRIAPMGLRADLYKHIDAEIAFAKAGKPACIWAKMNALVDPDIIDKLYEASSVGVQIDLVVRGICCLRPNVKGLSENIRVKSIVGRFLEHSRIVCFGNGAAMPHDSAKVFVSSADWMPRNLDRRVETLIPIEDPTVHGQVLDQIMVANLLDNANSWQLDPDGTYQRLRASDENGSFSAHGYFMKNPSLSGRGQALDDDAPLPLETLFAERLRKP